MVTVSIETIALNKMPKFEGSGGPGSVYLLRPQGSVVAGKDTGIAFIKTSSYELCACPFYITAFPEVAGRVESVVAVNVNGGEASEVQVTEVAPKVLVQSGASVLLVDFTQFDSPSSEEVSAPTLEELKGKPKAQLAVPEDVKEAYELTVEGIDVFGREVKSAEDSASSYFDAVPVKVTVAARRVEGYSDVRYGSADWTSSATVTGRPPAVSVTTPDKWTVIVDPAEYAVMASESGELPLRLTAGFASDEMKSPAFPPKPLMTLKASDIGSDGKIAFTLKELYDAYVAVAGRTNLLWSVSLKLLKYYSDDELAHAEFIASAPDAGSGLYEVDEEGRRVATKYFPLRYTVRGCVLKCSSACWTISDEPKSTSEVSLSSIDEIEMYPFSKYEVTAELKVPNGTESGIAERFTFVYYRSERVDLSKYKDLIVVEVDDVPYGFEYRPNAEYVWPEKPFSNKFVPLPVEPCYHNGAVLTSSFERSDSVYVPGEGITLTVVTPKSITNIKDALERYGMVADGSGPFPVKFKDLEVKGRLELGDDGKPVAVIETYSFPVTDWVLAFAETVNWKGARVSIRETVRHEGKELCCGVVEASTPVEVRLKAGFLKRLSADYCQKVSPGPYCVPVVWESVDDRLRGLYDGAGTSELKAVVRLELKDVDGNEFELTASAPVPSGTVELRADGKTGKTVPLELTASGRLRYSEIGGGARYSELSAVLSAFGEQYSAKLSVGDPDVRLTSDYKLAVSKFWWASKVTVTARYKAMPTEPGGESTDKADSFKLTPSGPKSVSALELSSLPMPGTVTYSAEGFEWTAELPVEFKHEFEKGMLKGSLEPFGLTPSLTVLKNGKPVDESEYDLETDGYAVFEYRGAKHYYPLGRPEVSVLVATYENSARPGITVTYSTKWLGVLDVEVVRERLSGSERKVFQIDGSGSAKLSLEKAYRYSLAVKRKGAVLLERSGVNYGLYAFGAKQTESGIALTAVYADHGKVGIQANCVTLFGERPVASAFGNEVAVLRKTVNADCSAVRFLFIKNGVPEMSETYDLGARSLLPEGSEKYAAAVALLILLYLIMRR